MALDEISDEILVHHSSSFVDLEDRFNFDNLHDAIGKLPRIQRRRLMLYYFNDYSMEEIAMLEGCSQPAISKSISKAEKNLIKFLSEGYKT